MAKKFICTKHRDDPQPDTCLTCSIATSENKSAAAVELGRKGGQTRAENMTPEERSASASKAARARWARLTPEERSAEMSRRRMMTMEGKS